MAMGAILIVAVFVFMWWLPAYRESELQRQMAAIEDMEDLTARKEAALTFLLDNRMADRELLLRALDAAVAVHADAEDKQPLIDLFQSLYEEDLSPWLHYRVLARLDRGLIELGTPESVARAERLASEMLDATNAPMETYHWIIYFHQSSELTDPELTARVAMAAENAIDRDEYGAWPSILDMAFTRLLGQVQEDQGLEAALAKAEMLGKDISHPSAVAGLNASIYSLAVEEDPETAVAAARTISDLEGLTGADVPNRVAYDMAERGLAPDIAIRLSKQALELAESRYDSTMILDTVGWAHYAAGDFPEAARYLEGAVDMMDETLTSDDETVQHLLEAYEAARMRNESISLLTTIVARSVDADDPARTRLRALIIERDGSAAAVDRLVSAARYEGVKEAPGFALADREGNMVALEDMRGDIVLLNFWSYG
jgi:tetratricopeptide (TPR) repeat protein